MTKELFKANNVKYDEYNVGADITRREEMINKSGQMGVTKISKAVVATLEKNGAYVNVHTAKNAAGEIRGQVSVKG